MGITRLRLARFGSRNQPFYRFVAIDARKARDAKPIEYVRAHCDKVAGMCRGVMPAGIFRLRFEQHFSPSLFLSTYDPRSAQLGTYNPFPQTLDGVKEVRLEVDRVKYWLSTGAQPSERVAFLLWRAGLAPAPPIRWQTQAVISTKDQKAAAAAARK